MKATDKHFELDVLAEIFTGKPRRATIAAGECATCDSTGNNAQAFSDDLSRKEYQISGMCQKCQDDFFGAGEED